MFIFLMMSQINKSKLSSPRLVKSANNPIAVDQVFTCQFEIFGKVQGKFWSWN